MSRLDLDTLPMRQMRTMFPREFEELIERLHGEEAEVVRLQAAIEVTMQQKRDLEAEIVDLQHGFDDGFNYAIDKFGQGVDY